MTCKRKRTKPNKFRQKQQYTAQQQSKKQRKHTHAKIALPNKYKQNSHTTTVKRMKELEAAKKKMCIAYHIKAPHSEHVEIRLITNNKKRVNT